MSNHTVIKDYALYQTDSLGIDVHAYYIKEIATHYYPQHVSFVLNNTGHPNTQIIKRFLKVICIEAALCRPAQRTFREQIDAALEKIVLNPYAYAHVFENSTTISEQFASSWWDASLQKLLNAQSA